MVRIEVIPNRGILDIEDYSDMSYTSSHGKLFKDFCEKKKVPIRLPYIGGWYWAKEIAKLGHIAIMEDSFGICVYAFYKLDEHQRTIVVTQKEKWRKVNFSGSIINEKEEVKDFDQELLKVSNDMVIQMFVEELTKPMIKLKQRKDGL